MSGKADTTIAISESTRDLMKEEKPDQWGYDYYILFLMGHENPGESIFRRPQGGRNE